MTSPAAGGFRQAGAQVAYEQLLFWRNSLSAMSTVALPLALLAIIGTLNQGNVITDSGAVTFTQFYLPGVLTFAVIGVCYANLAITMSHRRDFGILKHLRSTPLSTASFLTGVVASSVITSALVVAATMLLGALAYDAHLEASALWLLVVVATGVFTFTCIGFVVSRVRADSAIAVVNLIFFPLLMISNILIPIGHSSAMSRLASLFPAQHFGAAMAGLFLPGGGRPPMVGDLAVLAAWAVGCGMVAGRTFRWTPKGR